MHECANANIIGLVAIYAILAFIAYLVGYMTSGRRP